MMTSSPATCKHVFVQTSLTKAVPTYCDKAEGCGSLCFVLQKMRHCAFCDMFMHEACFERRRAKLALAAAPPAMASTTIAVVPSGASPTTTTTTTTTPPNRSPPLGPASPAGGEQLIQQATHVHSLIIANSATLGSTCDVCDKHIFSLGSVFSKKKEDHYLMCVDCDYRAHEPCYRKHVKEHGGGGGGFEDEEVFISEEEYMRKVEAQKQIFGKTKSAVVSGTYELFLASIARNSNFVGDTKLVGPVALYRVQRKQAQAYLELCAELTEATLVPRPLLEELLDGLRYATAVYGAAYHEGFFKNVAANLMMQLARQDLINAKPEKNNDAVANALSISRERLLLSYWGTDMHEPTFVVIDDDDGAASDSPHERRVIVAFRGSLTEADFLTDACATLAPQPAIGPHAKAHSGIAAAVDKLFDPASKLFLIPRLVAILKARHRRTRLDLVGHSLGGGICALFAARALATDALAFAYDEDSPHAGVTRSTRSMLRAFAFAPPPVLTQPAADRFEDSIVSVVAAKDLVPRLQLPSVDRLRIHMVAAEQNQPLASTEEEPTEATETEKEQTLRLCPYLRDDKVVRVKADSQEELHLVGRVVFTTHPTNKHSRAHFLHRESALLHNVFVSQNMVANHVMDNYAAALSAAMESLQHHQQQQSSREK